MVNLCSEALQEGDILIQKQNEEILTQNHLIIDLEDQNAAVKLERDQAKLDAKRWYKDPLLLIGLGFLGGVLVTK